jgi:hypothetical protein
MYKCATQQKVNKFAAACYKNVSKAFLSFHAKAQRKGDRKENVSKAFCSLQNAHPDKESR